MKTLTLTIDERFLRDVMQELILKYMCGDNVVTAARHLAYTICKAVEGEHPTLRIAYKSKDPNASWKI